MKRTCPWCCEPLPRQPGKVCPHCVRPLEDASGRELRPIDVRFSMVEARQCARFRTFLIIGVPTTVAIALAMPFLHLAAVAIAPLVAVFHLVIVRWTLVADALRVLGPTRRRFNRWLARFAFLWVGVPGYAAMVTPVAGAVAGVGTFAGLTALVHHYALWSLGREFERRNLAAWEKALLAVLAVVTLLLLTLVAVLALLLGWSVAALLGALTPGPG